LVFLVSCSSTEQSQVIESSTTTESIPTTETITPSTTEGVKNTSTTTIELPALSVSATIESAPNSPIAASIDIQSSNPVAVQVTATSDNHQVATPRTSSYSSSHTFPLVGLRQSQSYNIEISTIDEYEQTSNLNMGSFVTGEIDYPLPDFDLFVDPERAQPGVTLLEYNPWVDITRFGLDLALIGLDNEGQVVFFHKPEFNVGGVEPTEKGNFISNLPAIGGALEFDILGNTINKWTGSITSDFFPEESTEGATPIELGWLEFIQIHHETFAMNNGNYLALSGAYHSVSPELRESLCPEDEVEWVALSDVVIEFNSDGELLRSWDLWDVIDFEEMPTGHMCVATGLRASETIRDWTHANAVIYDETRDAILISSRHTDQIVAFDHLDEMGHQSSLRWILGVNGTIPLEGDQFYHPHAIELQTDGSILLYDNGNTRPDPVKYSRAVQYQINDQSADPSEWTATQVWEHTDYYESGEPVYAAFLSDADRTENGNVLITHGGITKMGYQTARITEVVPENQSGGDIVWDLSLGTEEVPVTVYRSERLPSLYFGPMWETAHITD